MYYGTMWASNEGQSDYFSALKCIRKYFAYEDNVSVVSQMNINPIVYDTCRTVFNDSEKMAICMSLFH